MKKVLTYALAAVFSILMCCACAHRGRVIPKQTLSHIYEEMFLTDQWINSEHIPYRATDTTLVYEAIFRKYGYTSEDYRASVEYYIKDPDRFARILRNTSKLLDKRTKELKARKKHEDYLLDKKREVGRWKPERIYFLSSMEDTVRVSVMDSIVFHVDSLGGRWDFTSPSDTVKITLEI